MVGREGRKKPGAHLRELAERLAPSRYAGHRVGDVLCPGGLELAKVRVAKKEPGTRSWSREWLRKGDRETAGLRGRAGC